MNGGVDWVHLVVYGLIICCTGNAMGSRFLVTEEMNTSEN